MPQLFYERCASVHEPATHALLIGVGHYPAFVSDKSPMRGLRLGANLPSASASAERLATFLLRAQAQWRPPVASIDLVTSTPSDSCERSPTSMPAVREAFLRWRDKCDSHVDNVALFYFAGHGLQRERQYLLTSSFGCQRDSQWQNAFDFDGTRNAFAQVQASTQFFLIDACRIAVPAAVDFDSPPPPLLEVPPRQQRESLYGLTLRASTVNAGTYGRTDGLTLFAEAILSALDPQDRVLHTPLTTYDIARSVDGAMQRFRVNFPNLNLRCSSELTRDSVILFPLSAEKIVPSTTSDGVASAGTTEQSRDELRELSLAQGRDIGELMLSIKGLRLERCDGGVLIASEGQPLIVDTPRGRRRFLRRVVRSNMPLIATWNDAAPVRLHVSIQDDKVEVHYRTLTPPLLEGLLRLT